MVYVELSKLREIMKKSVSDMTDLEKWAIFFQYASEPTYRETVNQVIASKEVLQMAGELLMSISQDERKRAVFRSRRMYQTDLQSDLATAEDRGERRGRIAGRQEGLREGRQEGLREGRQEGLREGRQEGLREGLQTGRLEIARSMIADGEPVEKIMRYTGLTQAEINTL